MWFYSVIFILLIIISTIGYFINYQKQTYWCCILMLIIIAAFRPSTCCQDYEGYVTYYNIIEDIPLTFLEPTFFAIAWLSKLLFKSYIGIFIIYSILGVGLKGIAIIKLTKYYSLSLILYWGSYFLLHEMTQIRVGVAAGILLISIPYIQKKAPYPFFLIILIGCLFHYSLAIFVVFYFIDPNKINKNLYIASIFIVFFATVSGLNIISILSLIKLGFLSQKIETYQALLEQGVFGGISLLNPLLFLRIIILIFFISNYEILLSKNKYAVTIVKIYAFSIFSFIALSPLPVLAGRLSQLLGIVEIILIPYLIYFLKPWYITVIIILLFIALIMYKQLYYSNLMSGYFNFNS